MKEVFLLSTISFLEKGTIDYCGALEVIILPVHITSIGEGKFLNCFNWEEIKLPTALEIIFKCASQHCTSPAEMIAQSNIQTMGKLRFQTPVS